MSDKISGFLDERLPKERIREVGLSSQRKKRSKVDLPKESIKQLEIISKVLGTNPATFLKRVIQHSYEGVTEC